MAISEGGDGQRGSGPGDGRAPYGAPCGGRCGAHAPEGVPTPPRVVRVDDDALLTFVDGEPLVAFSRRLALLGPGSGD